MRFPRVVGALLTAVLLATAGCGRVIDGTAAPDPAKPPSEITEDGSGILIGFPDAPAQIEIFTEPQCPHCAQLQHDFGRQISSYVSLGQLAVTYRPMTFLDSGGDDYSARVSNALFLAAGPGTDGVVFEAYVRSLWDHQRPGGPAPSDSELADLAERSGVTGEPLDRIAAGDEGVDVAQMADQNTEYLYEVQYDIATPTIYDLVNDDVLDAYDDNWLTNLMSSV
ncbi:DsbA family protein [Mycobacterium sp. NPDC003449]